MLVLLNQLSEEFLIGLGLLDQLSDVSASSTVLLGHISLFALADDHLVDDLDLVIESE